jgi:hypothetical protein
MRLTSWLAAVGMVATGLVTTAQPAAATGACSLYVPSRIAVAQHYRAIGVRLGSNCVAAGVSWANWDGYHPTQGLEEILIFDGSTTEYWDLYDWDAPLGRWTWRPEGAYKSNFEDVYQYGPYYTDVRLASYGRATATRSGSKVNVRSVAMRYWTAESRFIGWAGARGQLQYRVPGTTIWRGLKEVYSYSNGAYSYTYTTNQVRDYRVVLYDYSTIWGSTSPVVRK